MKLVVNNVIFEVVPCGEIFRKDSENQPVHEWVFTGLSAFNVKDVLDKINGYLN